VSLRTAIMPTSLNLIGEELSITLAKSASEFEAFVADPSNHAALESSMADMSQVGGTLRMVQLSGAALLADEMVSFLDFLKTQEKLSEAQLAAISEQFFLLPRYIEFLGAHQFDIPVLLLDAVNGLRSLRKAPLLSEVQFADLPLSSNGSMPEQAQFEGDREALVKRMRHLYQAGLLNVLRNTNLTFGWSLMARASSRIACAFPANNFHGLWFVAAAVIDAFAQQQLSLTFTRKRLLGEIDKLYRAYLKNGDAAVAELDSPELRDNLMVLLQQVAEPKGLVATVCSALHIQTSPAADNVINEARQFLRGPSAEAIETVTAALREEMHSAKDALELGAQNNNLLSEDIERLNDILLRTSNIMQVLNLDGPVRLLRAQHEVIKQWNAETVLPKEQVMPIADALLFIETGLGAVQRHDMSLSEFALLDAVGSNRAMSGNYLAEAEKIVILEAQNGLNLVKRALTAYADSGFDAIHIANVCTTLLTIRGGLQMLRRDRAAESIKQCTAFMEVQSKPNPQISNSQRRQLLELLADALISIEYYINELAAHGTVDEKTLELAEESLAALGYPVAKQASTAA
jgi:hypothetical protein